MLLSNAAVEHFHLGFAFAATVSFGTMLSDQLSRDEFLKAVTYEQLVSVEKHCERAQSTSHTTFLTAASASTTTHASRSKDWRMRLSSNAALKRPSSHCYARLGH